MAIAHTDTAAPPAQPNFKERVVDTARRVAHLSHDARLLKSVAADAVEDGVYQARRAMKSARQDFGLKRDDAAYRIRREPLTAVGLAFGTGLFIGVVSSTVAWLAFRASGRAGA